MSEHCKCGLPVDHKIDGEISRQPVVAEMVEESGVYRIVVVCHLCGARNGASGQVVARPTQEELKSLPRYGLEALLAKLRGEALVELDPVQKAISERLRRFYEQSSEETRLHREMRHAESCAWRQQCERLRVPIYSRAWYTGIGPTVGKEGEVREEKFTFGCCFFIRKIYYICADGSPSVPDYRGGVQIEVARTDKEQRELPPWVWSGLDHAKVEMDFGVATTLALGIRFQRNCTLYGGIFGWAAI